MPTFGAEILDIAALSRGVVACVPSFATTFRRIVVNPGNVPGAATSCEGREDQGVHEPFTCTVGAADLDGWERAAIFGRTEVLGRRDIGGQDQIRRTRRVGWADICPCVRGRIDYGRDVRS